MEKELINWLSKKLEIANAMLIEKDLYLQGFINRLI